MPERFNPEKTPERQLRPIVEIARGHDNLRISIENDSKKEKKFDGTLSSRELILDDSQTETAARELLPIEMQLAKSGGWRDGLDFVFGKSNVIIGNVNTYKFVNLPKTSRSQEELEEARSVVLQYVKAPEQQKDKILEDYKNCIEERANATLDGYIDQQMVFGDIKRYPEHGKEFFRSTTKQADFQEVLFREQKAGMKEVFDYALKREDENNGLAKIIVEKRNRPPQR